jgi:FixJ family two-component response regulator
MSEARPVVYVVDDEPAVCTALKRLIASVNLEVRTFCSAKEFLTAKLVDAPGCLVLDVRLPDLSGLEVQQRLTWANNDIPVIFMTGHGDIPMSVRAMKAGAVEFLPKPFREQELIEAIQRAIELHQKNRKHRAEFVGLQLLHETLTPREREVFPLVASGLLNKQIAAQLGTSEKTVKIHRGQIMHKMQADSLPHLVRMAEKLGVDFPKARSA